ncbi:MAG: shikimate kinase [Termitinemataceae bacterium]
MDIVFLVGPKHSGKTSTGKALAKLSQGTFLDLDDEMAAITGKSPRQLFTEGETIFRTAELESLTRLIQRITTTLQNGYSRIKQPIIIATGGGIADNPPALKILQNNGYIVYLAVSPRTAWERILQSVNRSGSLPPFLQTEHPEKTHEELFSRRAQIYASIAHLIIDGELEPPERRAELIYYKIFINKEA